jgi:hypothetical protein
VESRADCDGTENSLDLRQIKNAGKCAISAPLHTADEEISSSCVVHSVRASGANQSMRNHAQFALLNNYDALCISVGKILDAEHFL